MKIAFHFNADHPACGHCYGDYINEYFFRLLLAQKKYNISTKIFIGDLLLHNLAMDKTDTPQDSTQTTYKFNKEKYLSFFEKWIKPDNFIWLKFEPDKLNEAFNKNIHTICIENIDFQLAEILHKELNEFPAYLGALEVDDASPIYWILYSKFLISYCRVVNDDIYLFWDGLEEESKDTGYIPFFKDIGFNNVTFESLEGKHAIFDNYHDYEHAKRVAEWKKRFGNMLAYMADDVVSRLIDIAPNLGDMLFKALKTFEDSETNEGFSQVALTCRRIVGYIADCIYPPTDEKYNGHPLGQDNYINRILAYIDKNVQSDSSKKLIKASAEVLSEQYDQLSDVANKGVHHNTYKDEVRRCLIHTVILLDDINSVNHKPYKINTV